MVTSNSYIKANAPTIADNFVKHYLHGQSFKNSMNNTLNYENKYNPFVDRYMLKAEIIKQLKRMCTPHGLSYHIKNKMLPKYNYIKPITVKQYITRQYETTLSVKKIAIAINNELQNL